MLSALRDAVLFACVMVMMKKCENGIAFNVKMRYTNYSSAFKGTAGTYATEICEPRQVRKEAAVSEALCVPYPFRLLPLRAEFFINIHLGGHGKWLIWHCIENGDL